MAGGWRPVGPDDPPPRHGTAVLAHHPADLSRPAGPDVLRDVAVGHHPSRWDGLDHGEHLLDVRRVLHVHSIAQTGVMGDQRAAVAAVFDRAARTYDQVGVGFSRAVGSQLVSDADLGAGQRILDVGCGRGAVLFPAAAAVGESGSVLGIDLAPSMVELAAADAAAAGLVNVHVEVMDAQEPQLDEGSFDAVLSSLVVYFLPTPLTGLLAWRRALRPGGRLAVSTFVKREDERWSWLEDILPTRDPRATQEAGNDSKSPFDTDASLHTLLAEAGFVDPVSRTREHIVRFADPDQWVRWSWSHGMRMFWERMSEDEQRDARVRAEERLRVMQAEPEGLALRMVVRYTTARAAP